MFVCIQFICLAILLSTGPLLADRIFLVIECVAIGLGIWAFLVMRQGPLRIFPDVAESAMLIRQGPYRAVRHPMYSAVILLMTALVMNAPDMLRISVLIILCLDLLGKLLYEEKLLKDSFAEYDEYSKTTWRLIPFIF